MHAYIYTHVCVYVYECMYVCVCSKGKNVGEEDQSSNSCVGRWPGTRRLLFFWNGGEGEKGRSGGGL